MKPAMNVERIQQQHIICASQDQYGMNKSLQSEETVDAAWSRQGGSIWDDEEEDF
jgi:hypothetical protein